MKVKFKANFFRIYNSRTHVHTQFFRYTINLENIFEFFVPFGAKMCVFDMPLVLRSDLRVRVRFVQAPSYV